MIRYRNTMHQEECGQCHDGMGTLQLHLLLDGSELTAVTFMHDDLLEPGASIGEHRHEGSAEVYFVVEGHGTMLLDGVAHPIAAGDVSWCPSGHTHGIVNAPDTPMRLIVVGLPG